MVRKIYMGNCGGFVLPNCAGVGFGVHLNLLSRLFRWAAEFDVFYCIVDVIDMSVELGLFGYERACFNAFFLNK